MEGAEELKKKLTSDSKEDILGAVRELDHAAAFDLDVPLEVVPILIKLVDYKDDQIVSDAIGALTAYNVIDEKNGFLINILSTFAKMVKDRKTSDFVMRTLINALSKIATEFTYVSRPISPEALKYLVEGLVHSFDFSLEDNYNIDFIRNDLLAVSKISEFSANTTVESLKKIKNKKNEKEINIIINQINSIKA